MDLEYEEDCIADVDMNVVMTGSGKLIEIQATAEAAPFERQVFDELLGLAEAGISADQGRRSRPSSLRPTSATGAATQAVNKGSPVVLATGNAGKVREFNRLLAGAFEVLPLPPGITLPPETGEPLSPPTPAQGRSGVPSVWAAPRPCSPTIPGLEVTALGGRPGHLLRPLRRRAARATRRTSPSCSRSLTGAADRSAQFVCALCLVVPGRRPDAGADPGGAPAR